MLARQPRASFLLVQCYAVLCRVGLVHAHETQIATTKMETYAGVEEVEVDEYSRRYSTAVSSGGGGRRGGEERRVEK